MRKKFQSITGNFPAMAALGLLILIWQILSAARIVPSYMLPSPVDVGRALINDRIMILRHAGVTLLEALYGLLIGVLLSFLIATLMDRLPLLYRALYPIMVITQTIPTIAIAPLLVLWMGFGMMPKITLVVITTFFPITVGLLEGFGGVDQDALALMRSMGASETDIFRHVKLPEAMPYFFSGLKVSASYAVVAAVISEWLGGFVGLGVYMTRVKKAYAFDKMFAVILFIIVISLLLMGLVNLIRDWTMPWLKVEKSRLQD